MFYPSNYLLQGLWIAFCAIWIVGMLRGKQVARRSSLASELSHRVFLIPAILLTLTPFHPSPLDLVVVTFGRGTRLAGEGMVALGLAFAVWARITLGGNWSASVTVKENHQLTRTGPYALVRHPIYTGLLLMFLGTALAGGTLGALLGVPLALISFKIKSRIEEGVMREQFGDDYAAYAREVRALVPYVW